MMDLDRLEEVAREASPGPWEMTRDIKRGVKVWSHGKPLFTTIHGLDGSHVTEDDPKPQWLKDCDYLLATDPGDVLALIDRVRKAEGVVEGLWDAVDHLWAELDVETVKRLSEEKPDLVELAQHAHHRMSHEERTMHRPRFEDLDGSPQESIRYLIGRLEEAEGGQEHFSREAAIYENELKRVVSLAMELDTELGAQHINFGTHVDLERAWAPLREYLQALESQKGADRV